MCAMTGKRAVRVSGIGARLTDDLRNPDMYTPNPASRTQGSLFVVGVLSMSCSEAWLTTLLVPRYNYGQLQVWFEDGSVGWYEGNKHARPTSSQASSALHLSCVSVCVCHFVRRHHPPDPEARACWGWQRGGDR